jgi:hypothetical protein
MEAFDKAFDEIDALETYRKSEGEKPFAADILGITSFDCPELTAKIQKEAISQRDQVEQINCYTVKRDYQYGAMNRRALYAFGYKEKTTKLMGVSATLVEQGMEEVE